MREVLGEVMEEEFRISVDEMGNDLEEDIYGRAYSLNWDTKLNMKKLKPVTPGEILQEEFLKPMGLSQYRLAKEIGVPAQRISEIVLGERSITADTDLRLCRFFGLSNGYWLRAQAAHDTEVAEREMGPVLSRIRPWTAVSAQDAPSDRGNPGR